MVSRIRKSILFGKCVPFDGFFHVFRNDMACFIQIPHFVLGDADVFVGCSLISSSAFFLSAEVWFPSRTQIPSIYWLSG